MSIDRGTDKEDMLHLYYGILCVCVLVAQSCPTLCDPTDCSLPGSSVHGVGGSMK